MADDPRARRRRRHRPADHAIPRGGGRPRRRDLGHRPRPGGRGRHTGRAEAPGGRAHRQRSGGTIRPTPTGRLPCSPRSPTGRRGAPPGRNWPCRSPATTSSSRSPPGCASRRIGVSELSLRLPSLDEVFLALTRRGPADAERRERAGPANDSTTEGSVRDHTRQPMPFGSRRWLRHSLVLARRSLAKTPATPAPSSTGWSPRRCSWCCSSTSSAARSPARPPSTCSYLFPGILVMGAGLAGMVSTGPAINSTSRTV